MRSIYKTATLAMIITFAVACGNSVKDDKGDLTDKRAELAKLKEEQGQLITEIGKRKHEEVCVGVECVGMESAGHVLGLLWSPHY